MSDISPQDLLRVLGSGITPTGRADRSAKSGSTEFASMLDAARSGEIRSGLTVTADPNAGIQLSPEKAETLSRIADIAQAQGIERVLVTDGGTQYLLDVERRTLTASPPAGPDGIITGIDAAVDLDGASGSAQSSQDLVPSLDQLLRGLSDSNRFSR